MNKDDMKVIGIILMLIMAVVIPGVISQYLTP